MEIKRGATPLRHASSGWTQGAKVGPCRRLIIYPGCFLYTPVQFGGLRLWWDQVGVGSECQAGAGVQSTICTRGVLIAVYKYGVRWRSKHSSSACLQSKERDCSPR